MDDNEEPSIESFKNLFVIEGRQIFDFVQTTILKKTSPLCQIDGCKTSVYKLSTGDYICVSEENDLDQIAQITELLQPWLEKAEQTYIFPFQSAYTYNTQKEFDKRCFIRTISNSATIETGCDDSIAPMEDCNIVYGLSAGGKNFLKRLFLYFLFIHTVIFVDFSIYVATHSQATICMLHGIHGLCTGRFICRLIGIEIVQSFGFAM